ncbi:aminotransferase class V-fold PLP-dependent enzyme [uncultured Pseudoteredinibacter sp.]|uniref:aminotransferase class V-fold PLP-dependent enzyme n=1 Tax=uncultured Pseudoteredinibacter sp. TaxID=1641701 RepID=UPI00261D8B3B|nr:aminotransferase class V-fold PLP-dependent enzyme [uncultured Pseudoteredinibacter sp.]
MKTTDFDPQAFKSYFPALADDSIHYLDNAATTQKPASVIEAFSAYYSSTVGNAHRGSHRFSRAATETIESCRHRCAEFINAENANTMVFTQSCTAALNTLAKGLAENLQAGDEIILSLLEHHANLIPWQEVAEKKQLKLKFLPLKNGQLDWQAAKPLISDKTRIVSITACSNTLGCSSQLGELKKLLPKHCTFIVDAAQAIAHQQIDVQELECDFLCFSAHKMFGPEGLGILYGKQERLNDLPPLLSGGGMIQQVSLQNSSYLNAPHRFEAGSPATANVAAFSAALQFFKQWPLTQMQQHINDLCEQAHHRLSEFSELTLFSQANNTAAIVCFSLQQQELNIELADYLDQNGIAIRHGHHCTQPLLQELGQSSLLRASIAPYNQLNDIEALVNACAEFLSAQEQIKSETELSSNELDSKRAEEIKRAKSWQQRQKQLILWGKNISTKKDIQQAHLLIPGCESALWLEAKRGDGHWHFRHDSDARLIRGISALILSWVEGASSQEITDFDFTKAIDELQLKNYLSPSRSNGVYSLVEHLQNLAKD